MTILPKLFEVDRPAKSTGKYRKDTKFSDTKNFAVIHLKFKQKGQNLRVIFQNDANGIADSEDPDQTAPLGAV